MRNLARRLWVSSDRIGPATLVIRDAQGRPRLIVSMRAGDIKGAGEEHLASKFGKCKYESKSIEHVGITQSQQSDGSIWLHQQE